MGERNVPCARIRRPSSGSVASKQLHSTKAFHCERLFQLENDGCLLRGIHLGVERQNKTHILRLLAAIQRTSTAPGLISIRRLTMGTHDSAACRNATLQKDLHDLSPIRVLWNSHAEALPIAVGPFRLDR